MALGYGVGFVWNLTTWWATAVGFAANDGSAFWRRGAYYCFASDGVGVDPSYITTLLPLILVPLISVVTADDADHKDAFYARLRPSRD